jgi:uncharacterized membrane protein YjjP (DUF1212 family)
MAASSSLPGHRAGESPAAARTPAEVDTAAATDVVLRFMRAGHDAGYPTAELEQRVLLFATELGFPASQVSATPTMIEISLGTLPAQRSFTLRVRPKGVDLDAIARLDDLVADVLDGRAGVPEISERLTAIEEHPLNRRRSVYLGAYALGGGAVTPVLGGGWRELVAGLVVGFVVGAVALLGGKRTNTAPLVAPLAALAASFTAAALSHAGMREAVGVVTLAALVPLLPGMVLTIGMRELATEHLQSGVANTANALIQLLGLVFGVGIGRSIALSWFGPPHAALLENSFGTTHVLAAIAAGLAFVVTLRARARAAPVMCGATVLAITANAAGDAVFGKAGGVFAAALAIGVVGEALSARLRRSPLVFIVPGVLILVPGSTGFDSLLKLLAGNTVSGIDTGFDTFVTAMSIAYGLMVSSIVLPRRLTTLTSHRPADR